MTDITIRRALLSVSDKTGIVELGAGARRARRRARLDRRHRQGAARRGADGARHLRPDRLSRDDGRPRQDAAPQGAWRAARGARQSRAHVAAMDAHGIGAIDLVVVNLYPFAATVAKGAERATRSSRISTSAARRWSARRRRTMPSSRSSPIRPIMRWWPDGQHHARHDRKRLAAKAYRRDRRPMTRRSPAGSRSPIRARRFPDTLPIVLKRGESCATARTRTSRPRSTPPPARRRAASARPPGAGQGAQLQ